MLGRKGNKQEKAPPHQYPWSSILIYPPNVEDAGKEQPIRSRECRPNLEDVGGC